MSTPAPPPPPPFGYTTGPAAERAYKQQRRLQAAAARAQSRAAAQQARTQRAQLRLQMRAVRRNSLVGPLLLLALGTVLLLLETGHLRWSNTFDWLGHWWPMILILAGLVMVAEWLLDRRHLAANGTTLVPRRTLGGGSATLLILIALLGAGIMAAQNSSVWARRNLDHDFFRDGFGNWPQLLGVRSEFTQDLQAPLTADGTLTVDDARGDVNVTGSSQDGQVHVTVHQHLYAWQGNDLDQRRRAEQVRFTGDATHRILTAPSQGQDDADLTIELPRDGALTLRSSHGSVSVEELRGAIDLTAAGGDVKLTALRGPVRLVTQDDDADISGRSLGSGLTLEGRSGDINLSDVDGAVTLHGDFFGTTHLERIRGAVRFQSSFTNFACAAIPGSLNVEGRSDLDASRLVGPLTIDTTDRNLSLDGVRGSATINDRNGSVTLSLADPLQPSAINDQNGSVELSIPAGKGFTLRGQATNGEVQNDFGLVPEKSGETTHIAGNVGSGGPELRVQTTEGDLNVHRSASQSSEGWDDSPERITPAPAISPRSHAKHMEPAKHTEPETD